MIIVNVQTVQRAHRELQMRRLGAADRAADAALLVSPACQRNTAQYYVDEGYALVVSVADPCRILYCTEALQAQALQRYMDNWGLDASGLVAQAHSDVDIAADMDVLGVDVVGGIAVYRDLHGTAADDILDLLAALGYTVDYCPACPDRMLAGVYVVAMA